MTTKEVSKKWHISEKIIRDRCKKGLLPLAEKNNGKWNISENSDFPPCTPREALYCLKMVDEICQGNSINLFPFDEKKVLGTFEYLSKWNYITKVDAKTKAKYQKTIRDAKITNIGADFIMNNLNNKDIKKSFEIRGKLNLCNVVNIEAWYKQEPSNRIMEEHKK